MKIEIEINNEIYSWNSNYEDHTMYDIAEKFKGLLVSAGFHPDNVDGIFDEGAIGSWQLPSDKNLYADELEDEYDKHDNETNISIESLK